MRCILTFIFCLGIFHARSQSADSTKTEWRIKTNVPAILLFKPNVQFEIVFNPKIALEISLGYYSVPFNIRSTTFEPLLFKGPDAGIGFKTYLFAGPPNKKDKNPNALLIHQRRQRERHYLGLFLLYQYRAYAFKEICLDGSCGRSSTHFETRSVFRNTGHIRIQYGTEKLRPTAILEPFIGLGVMMTFRNQTLHWKSPPGSSVELHEKKMYKWVYPSLNFGLKWGCRIRKR